jgi:8-oxo-dGTP diphosphatase
MDHKQVRAGLAVFVRHNGKVLFCKRKVLKGEPYWGVPGGHLVFGENWEDCAVREIYEETGVYVTRPHFQTATNDIFSSERHFITVFMVCDYVSGDIFLREPDVTEKWEWFSWSDIPAPLFLPIVHYVQQGHSPFDLT